MKLQNIFDDYNKNMNIQILMNNQSTSVMVKIKHLGMRFGSHFLDYNVDRIKEMTDHYGKKYLEVYIKPY